MNQPIPGQLAYDNATDPRCEIDDVAVEDHGNPIAPNLIRGLDRDPAIIRAELVGSIVGSANALAIFAGGDRPCADLCKSWSHRVLCAIATLDAFDARAKK